MLERLPKALAQLEVGNTSANLLNKIRHIMYFLYIMNRKSYKTKWILYP